MTVYYNQRNYAAIPYPSPALPGATVASGGCGAVCASMLVENLLSVRFPPEKSAPFALACGARVTGGTDMSLLAGALCKTWPLKWKSASSVDEALSCVRGRGGLVIANVGKNKLFSDSGHYVLIASENGGKLAVLDPYLYAGKFTSVQYPQRKAVTVTGNVCYVSPADLHADTKGYYLFEKVEKDMEIRDSSVNVMGVNVPSKLIDGRNYVELRPMVEALDRALRLTVGWTERDGATVRTGE